MANGSTDFVKDLDTVGFISSQIEASPLLPPAPQPTELHYVYVVRCESGALYTGYAKNVDQRVAAHNAGKGARYTKANRPVELIICWSFETKAEALRTEYAFKQLSRRQKLAMIEGNRFSNQRLSL